MYKNEIQWCCPREDSPYYIYTIFVKSTGRVYVGYTVDPVRRFREHITTRGMTTVDDIPNKMSICLTRPRDHIDNINNLTKTEVIEITTSGLA